MNLDGLEVIYLPPELLNSERTILCLNLSYNTELKSLRGLGKLKHLVKLEAEGCDLESNEIDFDEITSLVSFKMRPRVSVRSSVMAIYQSVGPSRAN